MEGFVPSGVVARLRNTVLPKAFQTEKDLGNTQAVTFTYDRASDGGEVEVGPFELLVIIQPGGQNVSGGPVASTSSVGYIGEFRADLPSTPPFKVHRDYRFCLDNGTCGRLTSEPVDDIAFTRVPFVIER